MEMNKSKYVKWYYSLIKKAKQRKYINEYYEEHHIIPKSLGGKNTKNNLVKLTAKEHYIAHLLLMKCFDDPIAKQKMCSAYLYMSKVRNNFTTNRYNSKLYEYHKIIRIKILKEQMTGEGNHMFGKKHSIKTRQKISDARKGINTNTSESIERKRQHFLINNPNNNPESKRKQLEANSRFFKIQGPDGTIYEGKNLSQFCRKNNLNHGNLITYGKSNGWSIIFRFTRINKRKENNNTKETFRKCQ